MSCLVCHRAKCKWIELKDPTKLKTERLETVVSHNLDYIDMIFRDSGSAFGEERMINSLAPYVDEIEKRKARGKVKS